VVRITSGCVERAEEVPVEANAEVPVAAFTAAVRQPSPETRASAHAQLDRDVEVRGPFGQGAGVGAFDAMLEHPVVARLLGGADWADPALDGDVIVLTATAPPAAAVGGMRFGLHLDAEQKIDRIEQDLLPAPPLDPQPIALTDAQVALLTEALTNGTPMIVSYVDATGAPRLSYRATVQALGTDRLGMWIRDPNGGLVRALATNPHLACFYSDRAAGVTLQFSGRGHVDDDEGVRDAVYDGSPRAERDIDWRKAGVVVVVDLDRVEGRDAGGRVLMVRG
jgi:hypothetical protein